MKRHRKRPRRALILILALWIAVILAVMALSIAYEMRINMRLSRQGVDGLKARSLARLGMAKAVVDLRNDRILAVSDPAAWHGDGTGDVWADPEDKTDIEVGRDEGEWSVRVVDEESKLNVSYLTLQSAPILARILEEACDFDEEVAVGLSQMIVDWQDPDPASVGGGAMREIEHWTEWGLREFGKDLPEGWVFRPKNDRMFNLEELLEFPGITRQMLYGEPEPLDDRRAKRRRSSRRSEEESRTLSDYVTVRSAPHINVLTASPLVLESLFRAALPQGSVEAGDYATKIVEYREERLSSVGDSPNEVINAAQHLERAEIPQQMIQQVNQIYRVNIVSTHFTITSKGVWNGITKTLRAVVSVRLEPYAFDPSRLETYGRRDKRSRASVDNKGATIIDPEVRVEEMIDL